MLDNEPTGGDTVGTTPNDTAAANTSTRRTRARARTAPAAGAEQDTGEPAPVRRRARKTAGTTEPAETSESSASTPEGAAGTEPAGTAPAKATRRRARTVAEPVEAGTGTPEPAAEQPAAEPPTAEPAPSRSSRRRAPVAPTVLFMAPEVPVAAPAEAAGRPVRAGTDEPAGGTDDADGDGDTGRSSRRRRSRRAAGTEAVEAPPVAEPEPAADEDDDEDDESESAAARRRRRRGRRGRGRGKGPLGEDLGEDDESEADEPAGEVPDEPDAADPVTRRRRRRRRGGATGDGAETSEDGIVTVVKVRPPRAPRDEVQGVSGSTRLEAKRQRRRDGREQRRTRPPILSESEFLARREAVDRTMVIRQSGTGRGEADRTQIAVLEDNILVEHYVTRATAGSMVGNVYLGKVQNVLPSMEAAFVDIGRGRNAVLYAGEVNWDVTGLEGRARSIEQALKSGDSVLVQVTKDPVGHKGARLTSHIALSGRHLVYVPHGNASGISRKLPDTERKRLRDILKHLVPDGAGVIVRTAAEGAAEDELERDVTRLTAQWEEISRKATAGGAPVLLYEEPDLVIRVVRDLFNEDFRELVVQGDGAYDMVEGYLRHVSPDLVQRLHRHAGTADLFTARRVDEQILKGLDRKVFLPSGGSLVIDRTEAMTVIDVNTGKYTGTGGNLEETVTRNNLEAAEEIVRQLRLRDLGGIIVIDFIDMVLESNRELVLRRLTECLGRDRTKHQVTEITSLGLVQMTRKRIGQGLLEAFSETCEHCKGRGLMIHTEPVPERRVAARAVAEVAAAPAAGPGPATFGPAGTSGRRRGRRGGGTTAGDGGAAGADDPSGDPGSPRTAADQDPADLPGIEVDARFTRAQDHGETDDTAASGEVIDLATHALVNDGGDTDPGGPPRRRVRWGSRRRSRQ